MVAVVRYVINAAKAAKSSDRQSNQKLLYVSVSVKSANEATVFKEY